MINGTVKLLRKTSYGYRNLTVDVFHLVLQLRFFEKNLFLRLVGIFVVVVVVVFWRRDVGALDLGPLFGLSADRINEGLMVSASCRVVSLDKISYTSHISLSSQVFLPAC